MSNGVVRVPRLKEAIKSGWLEHLIREGWLRKRWRNRWCVLHRGMLYLFENQVKDDSDKPSSTISLDSYQAAKTANKKDTKKGQPTLELTPKLQNGKKDAKKALFSAENQEELDKWEEAIVKAMQKEKKPAEPGAPLEHVTKTRARPQANKRRPPSRDHLRGKRITTASTGIDLDISMETPTTENSSPAAAKKRGNRPTQAMRPNRTRVPSGGEVLAPSGGEVLAPSGGDDTNAQQLNGSTSHGESPPPSSVNDASEEETTNDERPPILPSPAHKPQPIEGEAPPPPSVDDVFTAEVSADEQETRNDDVTINNHNKSPPPPPSPACKPKFTPTTTTTDDVTTDDDDDVTTDDDVVDKQKPPPLPSPARKPLMEVKEEEEEEEEDEDGASFTDDELDEVDDDDVVDGDVIDDVETLNVNNCNSKSIPTSDEEDALPPNPNDLMELPSEVRDALDVLDEQLLDVSTSDDDDDDDTEDDELAHNNITKTAMVDAR